MKKTILLLLFTATSFAQNATWNGTKTIGTTFKMVGIQNASGGEKNLVLDTNGFPRLSTVTSGQVNSDWNATSGAAQILNKPNVKTNQNTLVGLFALNNITTGANNTAIGNSSLFATTTGANNTAIGVSCLGNTSLGTNNIGIGYFAGINNSGSNNTIIGVQSTGNVSNCVFIGNGAGTSRLEVNANGIIRFVTPPPMHINNMAATANGMTVGQIYQTLDGTLKIVN